MPKITVDKDNHLCRWKDNVGFSWQARNMFTESIALKVKLCPHLSLDIRILLFYLRHRPLSLLGRQVIGHCRHFFFRGFLAEAFFAGGCLGGDLLFDFWVSLRS
jgi:hypothetical protein